MIIAVTGTPGTGKTAVAKELAAMLGYRRVDLNSLAHKYNLYSSFDNVRNVPVVDLKKIQKRLGGFENCILDSHYSHELENDFTILLTCKIEILAKRLRAKGFSRKKVQENLQAEIFGIIKQECDPKKTLELDTSKKSAKQLASRASSVIKNQKLALRATHMK